MRTPVDIFWRLGSLVGTPTTFLDYLKTHVPSNVYELAFANIRPRDALRARLRIRFPPRKNSQS